MKYFNIFLVWAVVLVASLQLNAQTKPATIKFKAPQLYTQLGAYRDTVTIAVAEAESIIGQPLHIYDDKKGLYTVSSYQFLYRRRGVTENEETGKVSPMSSIISQLFKITPLPQSWIDNIREQVKSGEELFFFDVIAKDAKGRVLYAPNLKIMIK
jgi:hypothetical protein